MVYAKDIAETLTKKFAGSKLDETSIATAGFAIVAEAIKSASPNGLRGASWKVDHQTVLYKLEGELVCALMIKKTDSGSTFRRGGPRTWLVKEIEALVPTQSGAELSVEERVAEVIAADFAIAQAQEDSCVGKALAEELIEIGVTAEQVLELARYAIAHESELRGLRKGGE